jgi:hypothetical protein
MMQNTKFRSLRKKSAKKRRSKWIENSTIQLPLSLEIAGQKEKFPTKMAQLCKGEEDEGGQKRKTQHENECAHPRSSPLRQKKRL